MSTISPTQVSMYDFLYHDIQPTLSLLADATSLSIPQTHKATISGIQAIVAALLAYHQRHDAQMVSKKLFSRSAIKELRKYNAMNFATLSAISNQSHEAIDVLFENTTQITEACDYIALQVATDTSKIQILLNHLSLLALRELAILADYSQLDKEEIDHWFALQPQFLTMARFDTALESKTIPLSTDLTAKKGSADLYKKVPPIFDHYWFKLCKFRLLQDSMSQDMQQATPNYLKAIGRTSDNVENGRHNDTLVFDPMPTITLPHQRWLLQLAKISDIYLSRNRLSINSEPESPPTRPLVSLAMLSGNSEATPTTTSETPIEYDKPKPLWKNPAILVTLLVIGILGALAFLKYQLQQNDRSVAVNQDSIASAKNERPKQQDVAIVRIDDDKTAEKPAH